MKTRPLVVVEWKDAFGSAGWKPHEDLFDREGAQVFTVGWLMQDDKRGVGLVSGFSPSDGAAVSYSFIPRGMVKRVIKLGPKYSMKDSHG